MKNKEKRNYITIVTIKLQCSNGVEVRHQYLRLALDTINSGIAADTAKKMALYSPDIYNRHNKILTMYIMATNEQKNYEYTECYAKRIDDEIFEVEVKSFPQYGLAYCAITDNFLEQADLKCSGGSDKCNLCPKYKKTCIK